MTSVSSLQYCITKAECNQGLFVAVRTGIPDILSIFAENATHVDDPTSRDLDILRVIVEMVARSSGILLLNIPVNGIVILMGEHRLLAFTETLIFTEDLLRVASDDTLFAIQNALLENPLMGDVIKGTGGARKGRIGDPKRRSGKSGGFRFVYVYLAGCDRFYLLAIYSKKDKVDLTPKQAAELGELVRLIKRAYGERE